MSFIKKLSLIVIGVLVMTGNSLYADKSRVPEVTIPLMKKVPVIDGKITPDEWKEAAGMTGFCGLSSKMKLFPADAWFKVGSDGKNIYVALRCETGPDGILQRAVPTAGRNNMRAFHDDSIELTFVPDLAIKKPAAYHVIVNNRGATFSEATVAGKPIAWYPDWKVAGSVKDGFWDFELALPLSSIGIKPGQLPKSSGIRVCRNWRRLVGKGTVQSAWEACPTEFRSYCDIPRVNWDNNALVTQVTQLRDSRNAAIPTVKLSLFNPTGKTINANVDYAQSPLNSQSVTWNEKITVPTEETKTITFPSGSILNNETIKTEIKVTSADGQKTFYHRFFEWNVERPKKIFKDSSTESAVGFNFAYFPSYNKIILKVDLGNLMDSSIVKNMKVTLKDADGNILAKTPMPPVQKDKSFMIWDVPDLKKIATTGKTTFSLDFEAKGLKKSRMTKTFEHHVFPWEGNQYGKSDVIIPPFTALKVKDKQVNSILREHHLNNLGLWEQVVAAGKPLFKGNGMRLEAVIDGKTMPITGQSFKFTEKKDTRVKTTANWKAGEVISGISETEWDYDGMMKWLLTIKPTNGQLDALQLVIPLDDSAMPLFHTVTDGLRFNYAGSIPAGTGKIWDGVKCSRNYLAGSYVPYIWAGAEERGFCVFGDNDKGWVTSKEIPCQELIRENGTLYLKLNLITQPVKIDSERKIKIGFQATPVKPMPEDWRLWFGFNASPGKSKASQAKRLWGFYGSCFCWGGISASWDIYPRHGDITFWKMLAKTRKTKKIPRDYMKQWLEGYKVDGDAKWKDIYSREINYGFRQATLPGKKMFYTNGRGIRLDTPDGRTFIDEWLIKEFSNRESYRNLTGDNQKDARGLSYDLDPVESYRDYAMWWLRQAVTTGATDGIYYDDIFPASNFKLVGTDAYFMADGSIQPSCGIFSMREYVRRTAIMMHELGKDTDVMLHMTNTAVVPILAFSRISYDWEDGRGYMDYQDRYTRDYIRAETIGRQTGNVPFVLSLIRGGTKEQRKWCRRTARGVKATHEVRFGCPAIYDFGYGTAEVNVFNYWDKDFPVTFPGHKTSALALKKKDAAMVVVCDWGNGGDYKAVIDINKLGLESGFAAINAEKNTPLEVKGNIVKFKLKKHDFMVILLKRPLKPVEAK